MILFYFLKKGISLKGIKEYDQAIDCFDHTLKLKSNFDDEIYYEKGKIFYLMKKYEKAIKQFDKAIKIQPKNSFYYYEKGNCLNEIEKFNEAIEQFDQSIKINPKMDIAYNSKGISLRKLNRKKRSDRTISFGDRKTIPKIGIIITILDLLLIK